MSAHNFNNLQNAFDAAQRANGILSLIFEGFIGSIPRKDVQQALYSVQQEIYEVLRIVEALNWGDDQANDTEAGAVPGKCDRDDTRVVQSGLFDKLLQFAEAITEEAAGIDVELKRYRAEVVEHEEVAAGKDGAGFAPET